MKREKGGGGRKKTRRGQTKVVEGKAEKSGKKGWGGGKRGKDSI